MRHGETYPIVNVNLLQWGNSSKSINTVVCILVTAAITILYYVGNVVSGRSIRSVTDKTASIGFVQEYMGGGQEGMHRPT